MTLVRFATWVVALVAIALLPAIVAAQPATPSAIVTEASRQELMNTSESMTIRQTREDAPTQTYQFILILEV
jgi:hypothetical protein